MINFNDAATQNSFGLIPINEIAKTRLVLRGSPETDFITTGRNGESEYLACEFILLEGPHARRKVFEKIGISGPDCWIRMGKTRIRAILESARRVHPKDMSETAVKARQIESYSELNNLDLVIKIGIEHDKSGHYQDKNRVLSIITPDHFMYKQMMDEQSSPWGI